VRLILIGKVNLSLRTLASAIAPPIIVPSLLDRPSSELPPIVDEIAAGVSHDLEGGALLAEDRDWILANAATSLPEIEKSVTRLIALRLHGGNLAPTARRLVMSQRSLAQWLDARGLSATRTAGPVSDPRQTERGGGLAS
jgi:hypothetical protein